MKKNKKNVYIITAIICMSIIGIVFIKTGIEKEKNKTAIYNYVIEKNDDYEVLLKPNNFYETERLPKGKYYASNSINSYIISLKYNLSGNQKIDIDYKYNIVANLIGTAKGNDNKEKEIWNRKFIIKNNEENKKNNVEKINIKEQMNIDYEYYNSLVQSYEKTYKIELNAVLKIRLNISYLIKLNMQNMQAEKKEDFIELEIPITTTISEVKENYENKTEEQINTTKESNIFGKNFFYIIGGIFIIISIALSTIFIEKKGIKEKYGKKLKRILKEYSDLIVTITNEPDLGDLKIINVSELCDLIDIAQQSQRNIIYDKSTNKFYVIIEKYAYIYKTSIKIDFL